MLYSCIGINTHIYTVMHRLLTATHSEGCVIRRFHPCTNITECKHTNLDGMASYTPRLYGVPYGSQATDKPAQHVSVLNTVGDYHTMVMYLNLEKTQ